MPSLWREMLLLGEIKSMLQHFHPPLIVSPINHASFEVITLKTLENVIKMLKRDWKV